MQAVSILTPEQQEALQDYTRVTARYIREKKVTRARRLVNEFLAKRDELAEVLGVNKINIHTFIDQYENDRNAVDEAARILTAAVEIPYDDGCLNKKTYDGITTKITDYSKRLDITIYHSI